MLDGVERLTAEEMDERRQQNMAYEYLCHLEEAKRWDGPVEAPAAGVWKLKWPWELHMTNNSPLGKLQFNLRFDEQICGK